ncbi:Syndecan-3 [Bagarius yarrelli]|uniref:Syndecan n=1 Tax=Bagarius yarrelli TaxID=175774 RepID=A0A556TPD3_BAGYA|nr:Syndecan-3 [Bagarius yarrelli]
MATLGPNPDRLYGYHIYYESPPGGTTYFTILLHYERCEDSDELNYAPESLTVHSVGCAVVVVLETQRHSLRPVDQEGSADDLYDDEDYFSGSGSGYTLMIVTKTSSPIENIGTMEEEDGMFISTETSLFKSLGTEDPFHDDITTTEAAPITITFTTAMPIKTPGTASTAPPRSRKTQPIPSITPPRSRKPQTTPSSATHTENTHPMPASTVQVKTPEADINNEVAVAGPSGESEIQQEDGQRGNELGHGKGASDAGAEPDLTGNTIDTGSSAAQLPQKNILERKEVLIAVIVGGVVGALFAAFLVMLLVYRMKKKDEGSYTLEEPKQATVTYQKPDKQEEFYA